MTNEDISFILPLDYKRYGNSYSRREYDYDFSFNFYVNTIDTIKSVQVFKNGKLYSNAIVNNLETGYYFVKDLEIVSSGNYHYGVVITLNDNKIYKNGFYLKILNASVENDIKIVHFSTQGTHENFNVMNILLNVDSQYHIHSVELFRKYFNDEWEKLGLMQYGEHGYIFKELLFDVRMRKDSTCKYRVKILTSNGLKREAEICVPITFPTFSLNNIFYSGSYPKYDIYGGIVGKIESPLSEFNKKIFEMIVNTSGRKFLSIDLKEKEYHFYSENFNVVPPESFVVSQSDKEQNIYTLSGHGLIKQIISEEKDIVKRDSCIFQLTLKCGDTYSTIFSITPDNDMTLALKTEETFNNIVRYKDLYQSATYTYDDKTIANHKTDGILVYDNKLSLIKSEDYGMIDIPIDMADIFALFRSCDFAAYNYNNFYFINYSSSGVKLTSFDGINREETLFETQIYEPTLDYLKSHICFKFDLNNKICFEFINYDLTKNFKIVKISDNQMTVDNCEDNISIIFTQLRTELLAKLNELYEFDYDNKHYKATFSRNFLLKEQQFRTMNFENFVQDMYMYEFVIAVSSIANVNGVETECILSVTATVNIGKKFFDVEKKDFNYTIGDFSTENKSYNQKPINIMESLNNGYYIKLDNSLKTNSCDDYGHYTKCALFKQSQKLYDFAFEDFDEEKYFVYSDLCKIRSIEINKEQVMIFTYKNDKYLIHHLDLARNKVIAKFELDSVISPQFLLSLSDEQLRVFSNILSIAKQNEFVDRKMKIYSLSDFDTVFAYENGQEIYFDKQVSFSNVEYYNAFSYEYNVKYPLNIKNKSAFLQEPEITAK